VAKGLPQKATGEKGASSFTGKARKVPRAGRPESGQVKTRPRGVGKED